jgi:hypothetical protein
MSENGGNIVPADCVRPGFVSWLTREDFVEVYRTSGLDAFHIAPYATRGPSSFSNKPAFVVALI